MTSIKNKEGIKLFGYEIRLLRETTTWSGENMWHIQRFGIEIERITPKEKSHRQFLAQMRASRNAPNS